MRQLTTVIEGDRAIELTIILGEQLSAVTFVQDYLQLHFDGPVLTLFVWPTIIADAGTFEQGTAGYKDQLCSMISRKVLRANAYNADRLQLEFVGGLSIIVPLGAQFRTTPESAILKDGLTDRWEYW
jgi:hypothetical protein